MKRIKAGDDKNDIDNHIDTPYKIPADEFSFPELIGKYDVKCELGRG